ncbi:cell wall hydrolase [Fuchsiella alkaliacetigena]|uniref:cell wall hydrolase n=1 Tax=Fuchsiella alkaliacetigena TaxID=957042 RepID=UPI00200B440B|nr:cell wall hydrolase [Fuchsiella alkaliacetigena]MCK8824244.1 cell wall hydrolase [Fuchsiella alkaliacetigena]
MLRLKSAQGIKVLIITLVLVLLVSQLTVILPSKTGSVLHAAEEGVSDRKTFGGLAIFIGINFLASRIRSRRSEPSISYDLEDVSQSELDLLARLIHAEARGEPYKGQVAVGAVVLNRVNSPQFPNSIREVIYQSGQFAPVDDGQINLPANQTAFRAARDALSGEDPSLGALYFYNPRTARTLWWLTTRRKLVEIGNHVFAE